MLCIFKLKNMYRNNYTHYNQSTVIILGTNAFKTALNAADKINTYEFVCK